VPYAARGLGGAGRLVVLDRAEPEAFAVPASRREPGRIVVSAGLLRMLDPAERRVLLAHETAHLDHRHHRYRVVAGLIATVNPLLITLPGAVHHLTERWADEEAAAVADRDVAARALARTALAAGAAGRSAPLGDAVQCFHRHGVPDRVRALLDDAPPRRPLAAFVFAAFFAASLLSALEAGRDAAELFELAGDHAGEWATHSFPRPPEHGRDAAWSVGNPGE
jgi:Zn-dependent protease with chaperone function